MNAIGVWRKSARVNADPNSPETWIPGEYANTLNTFDVGDVRTTLLVEALEEEEDPVLHPEGMDSARYRTLGNAVAVPVAEWIGRNLIATLEMTR